MRVKIAKLIINDLYKRYNIEWNFNPLASVLVGDNGVGKSTILQILYCLLAPHALENNPKIISFFNKAELHLTNGYVIKFSTKNKDVDPEVFSVLSKIIKNKTFIKSLNDNINKKQKSRAKKTELKEKINDIFKFIDNLNNDEISVVGKEIIIGMLDNENNRVKLNHLESLFNIELVSTLFMNANSANEIKGSDGNVFTILDLEIDKQLSRLNSINKENLRGILTQKINSFFTEKKAIFIEQNLLFKLDDSSELISSSDLSSGERQLIYILLKAIILSADTSKTPILIMDEPEISLHLSWQEKLLKCLYDINPDFQIIVATHSPAIVMDGWMESYKDIKEIID